MDGDDFAETEAARVADLNWELQSDGEAQRVYTTPGASLTAEVSVIQLGELWRQAITFNYDLS